MAVLTAGGAEVEPLHGQLLHGGRHHPANQRRGQEGRWLPLPLPHPLLGPEESTERGLHTVRGARSGSSLPRLGDKELQHATGGEHAFYFTEVDRPGGTWDPL